MAVAWGFESSAPARRITPFEADIHPLRRLGQGSAQARRRRRGRDRITAAALLRCVLKGLPLAPLPDAASAEEGGILGCGSINLNLREATFQPAAQPSPGFSPPPARPVLRSEVGAPRPASGAKEFTRPIPGCNTVFRGSRGGWDGHVGSLRLHPSWRPELADPEGRRHQFRIEFPEFFWR